MDETLDVPVGLLIDLVNIDKIVKGKAKEKRELSDEDIIPDLI